MPGLVRFWAQLFLFFQFGTILHRLCGPGRLVRMIVQTEALGSLCVMRASLLTQARPGGR